MIEKDTLMVGCSDDLGWIIGYLSYLTADLDSSEDLRGYTV